MRVCEADDAWLAQGTQFAKADKNQLSVLFKYLDGCLEQIVKDNELGALKQALKVATLGWLPATYLGPLRTSIALLVLFC